LEDSTRSGKAQAAHLSCLRPAKCRRGSRRSASIPCPRPCRVSTEDTFCQRRSLPAWWSRCWLWSVWTTSPAEIRGS